MAELAEWYEICSSAICNEGCKNDIVTQMLMTC